MDALCLDLHMIYHSVGWTRQHRCVDLSWAYKGSGRGSQTYSWQCKIPTLSLGTGPHVFSIILFLQICIFTMPVREEMWGIINENAGNYISYTALELWWSIGVDIAPPPPPHHHAPRAICSCCRNAHVGYVYNRVGFRFGASHLFDFLKHPHLNICCKNSWERMLSI